MFAIGSTPITQQHGMAFGGQVLGGLALGDNILYELNPPVLGLTGRARRVGAARSFGSIVPGSIFPLAQSGADVLVLTSTTRTTPYTVNTSNGVLTVRTSTTGNTLNIPRVISVTRANFPSGPGSVTFGIHDGFSGQKYLVYIALGGNLNSSGRVGNVTNFGVGEDDPDAIAAAIPSEGDQRNPRVFMIGGKDTLYTLDTGGFFGLDGSATRVASITGETFLSIGDMLYFNDTMYLSGSNSDRSYRGLWTIDLTTAVVTRVGRLTDYGVSESAMVGLAEVGGVVYGAGSGNRNLYTMDVA